MKLRIIFAGFFILASLLAPSGAFAERNCPDGMYPIGGQGVVGCAPMGPDNSSTAENIIARIKQEKRQELGDSSLSHGSVSHLEVIAYIQTLPTQP